jgi:hypothetical protein
MTMCKFDSPESQRYLPVWVSIIRIAQSSLESGKIDILSMTRLNNENFSDSGYSTTSMSSDSDTYFAVEEVALLFLRNSLFRRLIERACEIEKHSEVVSDRLRPLIRHFGRKLQDKANDAVHYSVAQELIRHAPYIADTVLMLMHYQNHDDLQTRKRIRESRVEGLLQKSKRTMHPTRKLGLGEGEITSTGLPVIEDGGQVPDPGEFLSIPEPALGDARDFIADNETFDTFLATICGLIYANPMDAVQDELLLDLLPNETSYEVSFDVRHELDTYIRRELTHSHDRLTFSIRRILTLTGRMTSCYAHNAEAYMRLQWPTTYGEVLNAFGELLGLTSTGVQSDIDSTSIPDKAAETANSPANYDIRIISQSQAQGTAKVLVRGPPAVVIEIAQQISWLITAIRPPESGNLSMSQSLFERVAPCAYTIRPVPLQQIKQDQEMCWLPLFLGTVLARDYPVPSRGEEVGIEIPFHLLVSLAGPLYPVKKDGGIYLEGFSRALYPTSISKDRKCIQWHLKSSSSPRKKLDASLPSTDGWIQIDSPSQLAGARTFLGMFREAVIDLGTTKLGDYYRNIAFSGAYEEAHKPAIGAPTSITAGSSGMGIFGVTTTTPIIYGKSLSRATDDVDHDYLDILEICKERPVILYDTGDDSERGWMVPMLCVILHLIHTWAARRPNLRGDLPCIDPTWNGGQAAYDVLKDQGDFDLRAITSTQRRGTLPDAIDNSQSIHEVKVQPKKLESLVKQFWNSITQRVEDNLKASEGQPQVELEAPKIFGWDYMDIVTEKPYRRMQVPFRGNWEPFTRDILVLFGKGLGEVIRPADNVYVCPTWNPIPPRRQYLVAMVDCLRWLAWVRGGTYEAISTTRVANEHHWFWNDMKIFEDCLECFQSETTNKRSCVKFPQSLTSCDLSHPPKVAPSPPLKAAVVFGQRKLRKIPEKRSVPDEERELRDSQKSRKFLGRLRNHSLAKRIPWRPGGS